MIRRRLEHQERGEFRLRACGGLKRDEVHAGDLHEHLLELVGEREHALRRAVRLTRMEIREQRGRAVVDLRVVLHRARAERVHAAIDGVVELRKMRVVPHHLRLRELGKSERRRPLELRRDVGTRFGADVPSATARPRELDEQWFERLHVGRAGVGHRLPLHDGHRAATAWREPVISATASTRASDSLVISVHCTMTSSRPRRLPST